MDISNDIISFLFSFRKITLPGLGTIILSRYASKRNPIKNKLKGPGYFVDFHYNEYDQIAIKNFVEFISNKYKIDHHKADSKLRKYSLELLNNIANFGKGKIENLGTFSRINNNLEFSFSPVFTDLINASYQEYSLLAVKKSVNNSLDKYQKENNHINSLSLSTENRNNSNWIFPLIILTISSIILICFINCLFNTFKKFNSTQETHAVSTDSSAQKKSSLISESNAEFPFDTLKDDTINKENISSNNAITSNIDSSGNDIAELSSKFKKSDLEISKIKSDTLKKVTLEELINMAPELRKSYEKSCIIITGSFIKKYYADRMIKRLHKSGYSPYSEKYGDFHRTGVIFDCNKNSLNKFLKKLQNTIDPDSWILKWK